MAIAALNRLYGATCTDGRKSEKATGYITAPHQEIINYIMSCMLAYIESEGPPGDGADITQDMNENGYEEGGVGGAGSPAPPKSELISLPTKSTEGGGFKACDCVDPEIAAFCNADS